MFFDINDRVLEEAKYLIKTWDTVRGAAKVFGLGKSTVHKDVTERLKKIDYESYQKVKIVLEKNLAERHIRGGEATRKKYQLKKS